MDKELQDICIEAADFEVNLNPFDKKTIKLIKRKGHEYLNELVKYLCTQSNVKYAFVGIYDKPNKKLNTHSFYANGDYIKEFQSNLENSPFSIGIEKEYIIHPKDVQQLFPKDKDLEKFGIEGYIGIPLFNLENKPIGLIALMDDKPLNFVEQLIALIEFFGSKTELELGRLALKKQYLSGHEFKDVFQNYQDAFFMIQYDENDKQTELVLSPSFKNILGYTDREIKTLNFYDIYELSTERERFIQKVIQEQQVKNYPITLKKKDGSLVYVELDCECIFDNLPKNKTHSLRGVIKDVTQQHKENLRTEIAYVIARKSERRLTNVKSLVKFIRTILNEVVDVSSFYIALHDKPKKELYLPAFYDDDSKYIGKEYRFPFKNSLTEYIIKTNRSIIKDKKGLNELILNKKLKIRGTIPECFVGIPLKSEGKCFGAMVMQSYKQNYHYTKEDIDLFQFVSTQVAYVLERTIWQETLIKKEEHYRSLIENSSEIFGIINTVGIVEYISESTKRITGYNPSEFIGKNIGDFIETGSLLKLLENKTADFKNHVEVITIFNKKREKKHLEISLNKNGRKLIFNAKDVTSKIIAERKREVSQKQVNDLKNALNYSAAIYFTDCSSNRIVDVNKKIESLSGYTKKELIGESPQIFNAQSGRAKKWKSISNKIKYGQVWQGEMSYQKKDGSVYWVYETIALIGDNEADFEQFINIQYDITEEKAAKTNLIREVIEAQEQERERFAMEIHDGLGQVLLATKMNLNALNDSCKGLEVESEKILNNSISLLTDAVQEARNISHGLMSRVLNRFGLVYAVDDIINNIKSTTNIDFVFEHNINSDRFNEEIEMGLYRTLQELIKNIIRHSKASKAYLSIIKKENQLEIETNDNGIGIDQGTINNTKSGGIGLRNMKSRIEYLGGIFEIKDDINTGTKINIRITF